MALKLLTKDAVSQNASWAGDSILPPYSSDTLLDRMPLAAGWLEGLRVDEGESDRVAELVVSSLSAPNVTLMAKELFSAMHLAVKTGVCTHLRSLIEEWAETADVESDPQRRDRLDAAYGRALRGEGVPWSEAKKRDHLK